MQRVVVADRTKIRDIHFINSIPSLSLSLLDNGTFFPHFLSTVSRSVVPITSTIVVVVVATSTSYNLSASEKDKERIIYEYIAASIYIYIYWVGK